MTPPTSAPSEAIPTPTPVSAPVAPGESLPPAPSKSPAHVQVIAQEYSFTLSRPTVPAGEVIIDFVNRGQDPHNLHVDPPSEGPEAGVFPTTPSEHREDQTIVMRPGSYSLFCSLPHHREKGMNATLVVQ